MPDCAKCNASIPERAKVCPKCGAPAGAVINAAVVSAPDQDDEVHSLLLNAHLLKIRGEYEPAVAECIKALRINPDSVEAHTLLGDIYKGQGKIENAVHWYKLALDLSPNNRSNLERLDEIETPPHPISTKPAPAPEYEDEPSAPAFKLSLVKAQAVVILLLAALVGFLIFKPQHPRPNANPPASPERWAETQPTVNPQLNAPTSETPGIDDKGSAGQTAAQSPAVDMDDRLAKDLNAAASLQSAGLQIVTTSHDPRYDIQSITFISPEIEGGPTAAAVLQQCAVIAKAAFEHNRALKHLTIRALYRTSTEDMVKLDTVFVGDTTREKMSLIDPNSSSFNDQTAAFDNSWWRQDVK
ncbi:MAG TPA: tetratricopeptide repeat protein [Armatimonadota bacterium]|jgi:hypothetical protein